MSRPKQRPDQRLDQRLDDELRSAFKREQPSADFTMRVLERVALEPSPRMRWWQKLAMLLDPPKLRWVAIGVTASLLLAIGAVQYSRLRQDVVNDSGTVAQSDQQRDQQSDQSQGDTNKAGKAGSDAVSQNTPIVAPNVLQATQNSKRAAASAPNHRSVPTQHQQEMRAEGEAAKDKLMLALAIASSALSDAQKAVHDDDGLEP